VLPAPDGALWIATAAGLARISEGRITPAAGSRHIAGHVPGAASFTALAFSPDGSLWAATDGEGAWRRAPDGKWRRYAVEDGLSSNAVYALAAGTDGRMFFGTSMGLSLFDGSQWEHFGPADGLNPGSVKALLAANDGSLWLASEDQGVIRFDLSRFSKPETLIRTPSGRVLAHDPENQPLALCPAPDSSSAGPDSSRGRFLFEGSWYTVSETVTEDTLHADRLSLDCIGLIPWWPTPAGEFRFSWKLDNGTWSDFTPQSVIGLHRLERGAHSLFVRAKGPRLTVDPSAAIYRFFVDVPSLWSDWRLYALAGLAVLAGFSLLFRRRLAWLAGRLSHRRFQPIDPNPFDPERPVPDSAKLFGRDAELETLSALYGEKPSNKSSIILQGPGKSGVSSLLLAAAGRASARGAAALYVDLAGRYFPDTASLVTHLTLKLTEISGSAAGGRKPGKGFEALRAAIRESGRPVVILFDNAELLGRLIARDREAGESLAPFFRELVLSESGAGFVFGLHSLESFRERLGVLFNMSRLIRLGPLDPDPARLLLTRPLEGRVLFRQEDLATLVRLSGGQPYVLQLLGRELVELLNRERTLLCRGELVARAVQGLLQNPPPQVTDRWEELPRTEQLLLATAVEIAQSGRGRGGLTVADAAGLLQSHRISLIEEELAKAAAALAGRGLLSLQPGSGRIRVEDTLFSRWISSTQPVELIEAREEYDPGAVLRKLGGEMAQSFRIQDLAGRLLGTLGQVLHFDWGFLATLGQPGTEGGPATLEPLASAGPEAERVRLPERIAPATFEALRSGTGSIVAGEAESGSFPDGALLVPLLAHGLTVGLLVLGGRGGNGRYGRRDRQMLETAAEQAAVALENARLYEQETERERLRQELETARHMQMAILPERRLVTPGLELFAYLNPATEVGGDYFDYSLLDNRQLAFLIGDVSGHGISAGTLVSMAKSCIFNQFRTSHEVREVMAALNEMVYGALKERLLMTLCYAIFDLEQRTLAYSIAGHPFPYHFSAASKSLSELEQPAYPLGVSRKSSYRVGRLGYAPGDVFTFYSDGIVEGVNPEGEQFGFERLEQAILRSAHLDAESMNRSLIEEFHDFSKGIPQADDVTLVVIKTE
jgi:serine phosphatase RsbU (regulator of sigma subunit)